MLLQQVYNILPIFSMRLCILLKHIVSIVSIIFFISLNIRARNNILNNKSAYIKQCINGTQHF